MAFYSYMKLTHWISLWHRTLRLLMNSVCVVALGWNRDYRLWAASSTSSTWGAVHPKSLEDKVLLSSWREQSWPSLSENWITFPVFPMSLFASCFVYLERVFPRQDKVTLFWNFCVLTFPYTTYPFFCLAVHPLYSLQILFYIFLCYSYIILNLLILKKLL